MTDRTSVDRPVSHREVEVLTATLSNAPLQETVPRTTELISLRVVGTCTCGCDTVDFVTFESDDRPVRLADGMGTTPAGGEVGVIVWGLEDRVAGLEVYDLGAGAEDLRLPDPQSIRPFRPDVG